jgi:hypothetical protein
MHSYVARLMAHLGAFVTVASGPPFDLYNEFPLSFIGQWSAPGSMTPRIHRGRISVWSLAAPRHPVGSSIPF